MSENPLLKEIEKGTELKKTETTDKSQPQIESKNSKVFKSKIDTDILCIEDVHIKKSEIPQLLEEIKKDHTLKHTETNDKSKPMIDGIFLIFILSQVLSF